MKASSTKEHLNAAGFWDEISKRGFAEVQDDGTERRAIRRCEFYDASGHCLRGYILLEVRGDAATLDVRVRGFTDGAFNPARDVAVFDVLLHDVFDLWCDVGSMRILAGRQGNRCTMFELEVKNFGVSTSIRLDAAFDLTR